MKIIVAIISLALLFEACDIFETRDPESPSNTRSSFKTPVVPEDVIENLINSFSDKNANDYQKNFSPGLPLVNREFFYAPSGNVLTNFPDNWNVDSEFQYFNNLVSRISEGLPITLTLSNGLVDLRADSAIYAADYFLSIPDLNSGSRIFEGSLKFTMVTDINAAWVITYWEDIAKAGSKTWSELKIEFY
jgi:hypothetical protein